MIEANRRDQLVHRYQTFDELVGYCALSANPVGELVLRVFGVLTSERLQMSDKVCTALQLAEHWQDVGEDHAEGRIYLPAEDLRHFEVPEADLAAAKPTPMLKRLMAFQVVRANAMLDEGAPLIRTLQGRLAFAVAAFVAGGRSALRAIERSGYDVLGQATSRERGPTGRVAGADAGAPGRIAMSQALAERLRGARRVRVLRGADALGRGQLLLRHPSAPARQAPGDVRRVRVRPPRR